MRPMRFFFIIFSAIIVSCSPSQKPKVVVAQQDEILDSLKQYDPTVRAIHRSYEKELLGRWQVLSMKRQQKVPEESLKDVFVEFKPDSTFFGKAPCNGMNGNYSLKGTSIRFQDIIVTDMACEFIQTESVFLKLLIETVAAFTISGDSLLLRDAAGNIVFVGQRSR